MASSLLPNMINGRWKESKPNNLSCLFFLAIRRIYVSEIYFRNIKWNLAAKQSECAQGSFMRYESESGHKLQGSGVAVICTYSRLAPAQATFLVRIVWCFLS